MVFPRGKKNDNDDHNNNNNNNKNNNFSEGCERSTILFMVLEASDRPFY